MMGAKAFISLGEVYEVFIQVTATSDINWRNAVTILNEIVKKTMQDNACWNIKVKIDYEDSITINLQCAGDYLDDKGKCNHPEVTSEQKCANHPYCMYRVDPRGSTQKVRTE